MLSTMSRKPQQLAERWQCTTEHVLDLIHNNRLKAFSLSKPGSKRPRYRITDEAVAEYEAQHQTQVPVNKTAKPTSRRPRKREAVIQFYK